MAVQPQAENNIGRPHGTGPKAPSYRPLAAKRFDVNSVRRPDGWFSSRRAAHRVPSAETDYCEKNPNRGEVNASFSSVLRSSQALL
jgi:hypothetical protein